MIKNGMFVSSTSVEVDKNKKEECNNLTCSYFSSPQYNYSYTGVFSFTNKDNHRYAKWLYKYINRYSHGIYNRNSKSPVRVNSKSFIKHPSKITKTHILKHINNLETYYFTTKRHFNSSEHLLFMLDIDAHNEESDAGLVAKFIKYNLIPNSYIEESTHGLGRHLYFILEIPKFTSSIALIDLINNLSNKISNIIKNESYEAKVCGIYGLPTNKKSNYSGTLAKLPRPKGINELNELISLKYTTTIELNEAIANEELESQCFLTAIPQQAETSIIPPLGSPLPTNDQNNSRERKRTVVKTLINKLLRLPSVTECIDYYVENNLNNTSREKSLHRWTTTFEKLIKFYSVKQFKNNLNKIELNKTNFINQLNKTINVNDLNYSRKKRNKDYITCLNLNDIYLFINLVYLNSSKKHETSRKAVFAYFNSFNITCDGNKYKALIDLSIKYGLIESDLTFKQPIRNGNNGKIVRKGIARMIFVGKTTEQLLEAGKQDIAIIPPLGSPLSSTSSYQSQNSSKTSTITAKTALQSTVPPVTPNEAPSFDENKHHKTQIKDLKGSNSFLNNKVLNKSKQLILNI